LGEIGEGEILHDQVCDVFLEIKVECMIFDDRGVTELFDVKKVLLEFEDVLIVHGDDLNCVYFLRFLK
jgi:hypothetical protein